MNDDTTRTDAWGSNETPGGTAESAAQNAAQSATQSAASNDAPRVGFCQDCGRPLTQETVRIVGTGVFCEPCLTARVGTTAQAPGYATVPPYAAVPPYTAVPPQTVATGDATPFLAGLLGFIPGVGAMYNGQFAKGIVHLAIFVMLTFFANNFSGLFWIFCWGWIFYMAFEAYHTAVARRDGLPLPNAFGFNDIGERMGFGRGWGPAGAARPAGSGAVQTPSGQAPAADAAPAYAVPAYAAPAYAPVNPVPVGTAPDWVGYVPPTAFAGPPTSAPVEPFSASASQPSAAWHAPYAETYTGAASAYSAAAPPVAAPLPEPPVRRFPTGAIWLIGLGILILIANLLPDWKLTEQWWAPVFFAGLAVWLFVRRLGSGARLVCIIRWPVILMVLAVMLALHAAYVPITAGLTASVLLIAFGALLVLERTAGVRPVYAPSVATYPPAAYSVVPPGAASVVDAQAAETPARAAWVAPDSDAARNNPDDTKGGQ
jgi:hypothetical protein